MFVDLLDGFGRTSLHYMVDMRRLLVAKTLLEAGADLNVRDGMTGRTPVINAAQDEEERKPKLLLDKGGNLNLSVRTVSIPNGPVSDSTVLHTCPGAGQNEQVEMLLRYALNPM